MIFCANYFTLCEVFVFVFRLFPIRRCHKHLRRERKAWHRAGSLCRKHNQCQLGDLKAYEKSVEHSWFYLRLMMMIARELWPLGCRRWHFAQIKSPLIEWHRIRLDDTFGFLSLAHFACQMILYWLGNEGNIKRGKHDGDSNCVARCRSQKHKINFTHEPWST